MMVVNKKARGASDAAGDVRAIVTRLIIALALIAVFYIMSINASTGLDVSRTDVVINGLPQELDGLRIAQLSDFHSSWYGEEQSELIEAIKDYKPDL